MTSHSYVQRIAELEADNRRLRRLLDQQEAPGELRHRLRTTLALLRAIVRRSADTERALPDYVAHLEDRLDAIARAQGYAEQHGEIALQTLLAEELLQYGAAEGERLQLSGPDVRFQPRAGQLLALAVHELAANAVEHGGLGTPAGEVEISWSVSDAEPDPSLLLVWTERGVPSGADAHRSGFGMEVLTRMLPHALKVEVDVAFASRQLRVRMQLPLPKHVGRTVPTQAGAV